MSTFLGLVPFLSHYYAPSKSSRHEEGQQHESSYQLPRIQSLCKTGAGKKFDQRKEKETNSGLDDSPERAIRREGLSWTGLVAISVEYRFTMPNRRSKSALSSEAIH